jgi:hypothetical protein
VTARKKAEARRKGEERCPVPGGESIRQEYYRRQSSQYKIRVRTAGFLFGFITVKMGPDRLSRNVGKKLPLLAA